MESPPRDLLIALTDMTRRMHWAIVRGVDDPDAPAHEDNPGQIRVLHILRRHRHLTMNEIATHMQVSRPTVSGIVRGLTERGWVERVNDPDDWRTVHARITPLGDEVLERHKEGILMRVAGWVERLPIEQQQRLVDAMPAMRSLADVLDDRLVASGGHRGRNS